MHKLRDLPIKRKLVLVTLLTCGIVLALACGALFWFQTVRFRRGFAAELESLGAVIAYNTSAPLTFGDQASAVEVLSALKVKPQITSACLFDQTARLFARYGDEERSSARARGKTVAGVRFVGGYATLELPVMDKGARLGTLQLRASFQDEYNRLLGLYGSVLAGILAGSLGLIYVLASGLQGAITGPIAALATTAHAIADKEDFTVRAPPGGKDEVGLLTAAFNRMLAQIETHNAALCQANQKLEQEVIERKRTEMDLACERDLLKTLFDNLPDRIYFKDFDSRFVRVSQSKLEWSYQLALSLHQHQADGSLNTPPQLTSLEAFAAYLPGKSDSEIFPEEHARPACEDDREILRTGQPIIGKIEPTAHPDGRVSWCLTTKMPWRDQSGKLIGTFGVSKDITPLKEAETQVEALHKQLMISSRQAGMAEVATGVLHNVGNVLNSVNVSMTLMHDHLRHSEVATLVKVGGLLQSHASNYGTFLTTDPKGKLVPGFIVQLAQQLAEEHKRLQEEHEQLVRSVEHIKEIVSMQQTYASVSGVLETVAITGLVDDALRLHTAGLARHGVQVKRQDSEVPRLTLDKHKVLQILVNLIQNAKYALEEARVPEKLLMVGIHLNGGQRLKITVSDNGVGIPPENLTRIFSHGFTTRKGGHGFGLHSGANAAKEMGGVLTAQSNGLGHGATFTLELPLRNGKEKV